MSLPVRREMKLVLFAHKIFMSRQATVIDYKIAGQKGLSVQELDHLVVVERAQSLIYVPKVLQRWWNEGNCIQGFMTNLGHYISFL